MWVWTWSLFLPILHMPFNHWMWHAFKPFKSTFWACMDIWSLANKGKGAKKEDLVRCVSWRLKNALTHNNITKGFMTSMISPLNPSAMNGKMQPSESYARVEEEIGSQEVEVEELLNVSLEDKGIASNTCHHSVDVDEEDNHRRGITHEDDDVEECGRDGSSSRFTT